MCLPALSSQAPSAIGTAIELEQSEAAENNTAAAALAESKHVRVADEQLKSAIDKIGPNVRDFRVYIPSFQEYAASICELQITRLIQYCDRAAVEQKLQRSCFQEIIDAILPQKSLLLMRNGEKYPKEFHGEIDQYGRIHALSSAEEGADSVTVPRVVRNALAPHGIWERYVNGFCQFDLRFPANAAEVADCLKAAMENRMFGVLGQARSTSEGTAPNEPTPRQNRTSARIIEGRDAHTLPYDETTDRRKRLPKVAPEREEMDGPSSASTVIPPRRTPDLQSSLERTSLLKTLASELATIKQELKKFCTAEDLKKRHPIFTLWEHIEAPELQELVDGDAFTPKAYAENLVLRKYGLTSRETLKKDRKKLRKAKRQN